MSSTPDFLWKIAAEQYKVGNLKDSHIERFFRPKINEAHWRKMHRFNRRIEKELKSNV